MAEREQSREDVTCSICFETFREPVTLPCQHTFCRQCLGLYADKCKQGQRDDTSFTAGSEDVQQMISCPMCRAQTSLGREGVAALPVNLHLSEICHPNRGPLKRHHLISAEEYVSQRTSQGHVNIDDQSRHQPSCTRHDLPLGMYCVTCRLVICNGCLTDHPEHGIRDLPSAAEKDKPAVLNKTSELEKILQETKESLSRLMTLDNKIQENQDLNNREVEKAYNAALKDLDAWRQSSLDDIKERYAQWSVQCSTIMKHLRIGIEEMERMVEASKDLLSSKDVSFLQDCTGVTKAIDDQLTEKTTALEKHEVNTQKLSDSVQRDLIVPRQVTVKETAQERHGVKAAVGGQLTSVHVTKPTLRFTKTSNGRLRITDEGSVVKGEDLSWWGCGAVTDGRFGAGRYYWQLHITCSPVSGSYCTCAVGVVQEGRGLWQDTNPGSDSWYIKMAYSDDKVRCVSDCGGEIKPDYQQRRPHTGPHHVGVYLDCDQRSLIILDCGHNQVIATVRGLRVTPPLVPRVRFYDGRSVSARLVTGDSATLPQVLSDMLNTS